jgi:hypothetical protein
LARAISTAQSRCPEASALGQAKTRPMPLGRAHPVDRRRGGSARHPERCAAGLRADAAVPPIAEAQALLSAMAANEPDTANLRRWRASNPLGRVESLPRRKPREGRAPMRGRRDLLGFEGRGGLACAACLAVGGEPRRATPRRRACSLPRERFSRVPGLFSSLEVKVLCKT